MRLRLPWTPLEKEPEQAPGRSWRQTVPVGCAASAIAVLLLGVAGVAAVAFYLGIDVLAGWIVRVTEPLIGPPLFTLIGAVLILFAGWALFRLATGHAPPGTSRRDMIIAVLVLGLVAVLGVGALVAAFAPQAPDTPGF